MRSIFMFIVLLPFFLYLNGQTDDNITYHHSKNHHFHKGRPTNDTTVKILQTFKRDDGNGEGVIIARYRDDSLADKWLEDYIKQSRQKLKENYLKQTKSSGCSNLDFEDGNFNSWTCRTGENNGYPAGNWTGTNPVSGRHTITSSGNDPYGNFPMVAPNGGSFSVKLGNSSVGAQAEQLIYNFTVGPTDTTFIYKYAVVFEDPGHDPSEQPYFDLVMYDQNHQVIPCSYQHYVAGGSIPGFQSAGDGVYYKP